ncbi:molybdopterin-dependent oxidoreductase [Archangium violaceum]|nr:molybdopterin-dependent oxidoreductase [Archangium violaceum]
MGISFGFGGASNYQQDLSNADCILIQGSNMAECHPVGFQWVMEAKARGATLIHVDPRYTRTSALSNLHVPIRAGSDIAFLGGLVRYVLENEHYFKDYVVHYTNAAAIIREGFQDTEDLEGLFSGWKPDEARYDPATWQYEGASGTMAAGGQKQLYAEPGAGESTPSETQLSAESHDYTLQHPRCVFQLLRRHFSRYTPDIVEQICGIPQQLFLKVAEALCQNSGRERTSAFCYSVGWTQHLGGVQYIRTASILQLLLGNMGRPGGGILALRGHSSIQGSSDIPTLYNILPGYLPMPHARSVDLETYLKTNQAQSGWWGEMPKYMVSLLKAYFGDAARADNDYLFGHLPRLTGDHSHLTTITDMADGKVKGYFVMGQNPAVGSSGGALQRKGLRELDWLVVRDLVLNETAEFWQRSQEIESGEVRPEDIQTEVFFFPVAAHTEKEGTFTNTQRLLQWREKAVEPPGEARSELHFIFHLGRRLKELYASSQEAKDRPVQDLFWDYPVSGPHQEPEPEAVLKEISGYRMGSGAPVRDFTELAADGSTACGCWIYSGCFAEGVNQTARRKPGQQQSLAAPEWGWAWPANRRLLYNRASADPEGRPWSERKKYVWWDAHAQRWTGEDVPDFIVDRPPSYRPPEGATGVVALSGIDPFLMQVDGKGWLFAPTGIIDGPLPTHYEPQESVIQNPLYPKQQCDPMRQVWRRRDNPYHRAWDDPRYPYVLTTYRLTEHHTAGGMSRWLSWLSELQPEMFCEVSPELARERGLIHGGWATVSTARAEIECRVLVTERMRPLKLNGRLVHQIGLPYHWGVVGRARGDSVNELIGFVGDPNVSIQESKAFTGTIVPGRRAERRGAMARRKPPPLPPGTRELNRGAGPRFPMQERKEQ